MKQTSFVVHLGLALTISFTISILLWVAPGIFDAAGFWTASLAAGLAGAAAGSIAGRNIIVTLAMTVIVRMAILYFALNG